MLGGVIRQRMVAEGPLAPTRNHAIRATGITAYLGDGGALEHEWATHESLRTTKLYDETKEQLTQDEVERIKL